MFSVRGVVTKVFSTKDIEGKNGKYTITEYIIQETESDTWHCMSAIGKMNEQIVVGNTYDISFLISTREYNGRCYQSSKIMFANLVQGSFVPQQDASSRAGNPANQANTPPAGAATHTPERVTPPSYTDDLPF